MASSEPSDDRKRVKILIIGAGMAGLSAANHLAKNGMTDFLVLEASNKIGGRIFSAQTGTLTVALITYRSIVVHPVFFVC